MKFCRLSLPAHISPVDGSAINTLANPEARFDGKQWEMAGLPAVRVELGVKRQSPMPVGGLSELELRCSPRNPRIHGGMPKCN